jgi:hypothetical protein
MNRHLMIVPAEDADDVLRRVIEAWWVDARTGPRTPISAVTAPSRRAR